MSTPPRLNQLECPNCRGLTWIIGSDHAVRQESSHRCPACDQVAAGWTVQQQSPPAFMLQPHELYPMTLEAFDYWVGILRTQFPDHRLLSDVGSAFVPFLPEQAAARRAEHDAAHSVCEMRDQDGARRVDPSLHDLVDWVEMMREGDVLVLRRRDGGALTWRRQGAGFAGECGDAAGAVQARKSGVSQQAVRDISSHYLDGNLSRCIEQLRVIAR